VNTLRFHPGSFFGSGLASEKKKSRKKSTSQRKKNTTRKKKKKEKKTCGPSSWAARINFTTTVPHPASPHSGEEKQRGLADKERRVVFVFFGGVVFSRSI